MDKQDWKERHSYHKISSHAPRKSPTGRRIGFFLLPMFIVLYFVNSKAYVDRMTVSQSSPSSAPPSISAPAASSSSVPSSPSSQREFDHVTVAEEIRTVIGKCADDAWGQETLDKAELLANEIEEAKLPDDSRAGSVVTYLHLLYLRQGADEATDAMLRDTAIFLAEVSEKGVPDSVPERYRLALKNTAAQP